MFIACCATFLLAQTINARYSLFMLNKLNEEFGITGNIEFVTGPGGLPQLCITNDFATATITLHGAQVLSFQPRNGQDLLWVSDKSLFSPDKPIRGGVPLCWPWFNDHPVDPGKGSHGFARLSEWAVSKTQKLDNGATEIIFDLQSTERTIQLWPHNFVATLTVTVSDRLKIALTTRNTGDESFIITSALHTYLNISHINQVTVLGVEHQKFIDSLTDQEQVEEVPVKITREIDRIYFDHSGDCLIKDFGLGRTIRISKHGSRSTVLWNPWTEKALRMADFGDDEYKSMLCLETTNAHTDARQIMPGNSHTLSAVISVEDG
ncbi:MAG: D-hexose-6-phosphate mutarotase [Kiritimatiellae bacterium]|nr:D-hexose-6-phosphate mutarotase [Kiritimatiellia bacterium]